jgi:sec-independent protein translocase protein TatA
MGLGGISIWQLLIILAIVILIFGTKRLKTLGGDLGGALKSFRKAMDQDEAKPQDKQAKQLGDETDKDAEFSESKEQQRQES